MPRRARTIASSTVVALSLLTSSCSSDDASPRPPIENTVLPDDTIPAPGACDPSTEVVPPPQIVIDRERVDATLGTSTDSCSGLTGSGFITFNYNPVLVDAAVDDRVTVIVDEAAEASVAWADGEPLTNNGSNSFESSALSSGCRRVIIQLVSASGDVKATYGADIRIGGDEIDCPQRDLAPTEVPSGEAPPTNTEGTSRTVETFRTNDASSTDGSTATDPTTT